MNTRTMTTMQQVKLLNGAQAIKAAKLPERKRAKVIVNSTIDSCGLGWEIEIEENEFFNDILVYSPYRNCRERFSDRIEQSEYAELFRAAAEQVIDYDTAEYGLADIENRVPDRDYRTGAELVLDIFGVKATPYQVAQVRKAFKRHNLSTQGNNDTICAIMTALTPHSWECNTIRGCCQSDWATIYYPADKYSADDIKYYEAFFFGLYMDYGITYRQEDWSTFIPDYMVYSEEKLVEYIINEGGFDVEYGVLPEDVVIHSYWS